MNKANILKRLEDTLELRGFAKNTVKMYLFYGKDFLEFVNKDSKKIKDTDAIDYLIHLKEDTDWSSATINLVLSIVRYIFDVVFKKPISFRKLPNIRTEIVEPYTYTDLELKQLLQNSDTKMKAMILLGCGSGLRVSEVARLKVTDIDSKNMLLKITESKRRRTRYVKLSNAGLYALRDYYRMYRPSSPNGYLFPAVHSNSSTEHINPSSINNAFRVLLKKCNLEEGKANFHSLRHTFATNSLKNGGDIFTLKKQLGHAAFATTARYLHMGKEDIISSTSPVDVLLGVQL